MSNSDNTSLIGKVRVGQSVTRMTDRNGRSVVVVKAMKRKLSPVGNDVEDITQFPSRFEEVDFSEDINDSAVFRSWAMPEADSK